MGTFQVLLWLLFIVNDAEFFQPDEEREFYELVEFSLPVTGTLKIDIAVLSIQRILTTLPLKLHSNLARQVSQNFYIHINIR